MKYLGTLISARGHGEQEFLLRLTPGELFVIHKALNGSITQKRIGNRHYVTYKRVKGQIGSQLSRQLRFKEKANPTNTE